MLLLQVIVVSVAAGLVLAALDHPLTEADALIPYLVGVTQVVGLVLISGGKPC